MDSGKPSLLVVDDEPLNRTLLRRLLQSDYDISEAEDGDEALAFLASEEGSTVQIVLSDHLMPGMSGVELAAIIQERRPELATLLLTGNDQDREVLDAEESGLVAAVLPKPWRTSVLRALILEHLK